MRKLILGLLAVTSSVSSFAQLTDAERKGLIDTLYLGNLTEQDLFWERKPFNDPYRLTLCNLGQDRPVDAAEALMRLHAGTSGAPLSKLLREAAYDLLDEKAGAPSSIAIPEIKVPPLLEKVAEPLEAIITAIYTTKEELKDALSVLSPEEFRMLVDSIPKWAAQDPSLKFTTSQKEAKSQSEILAALKKVSLPKIHMAGIRLAEKLEEQMPALLAKAGTIPKGIKFTTAGVTVDTYGNADNTIVDPDADLVIDFGGNDDYRGRVGAGLGSVGALIDLGGNDRFLCSDLSMGAGLLGIGLVYDEGGNDTFSGRSMCFGSGLAGVGGMSRTGGNDFYQTKAMGQGFGVFGMGVLRDSAGRDVYDLQLCGQGCALTAGVGWLVDGSGGDSYRAGGLYLNSPLFADVYYSFAQGCGMGYRLDTGGISGGIGLITDLGGDDAYIGETYCQAASYWFGVGSLYDSTGHDTYSAYHYAQASAMHMCSAFLFDIAGDDAYVTKFGASLSIGHDYGVSFLLDRAGNDLYFARDSSPGVGNANGLGIFIDSAGEDRFQGPPGRGNASRGSGSLGVFLDLGGPDKYFDGLSNGTAAAASTWGVAYDIDTMSPAGTPNTPTAQAEPNPKPGSMPMPNEEGMEVLYKRATQWAVGTAVEDAAAANRNLIGIGLPALQWMIDRHLRLSERLEHRSFQVVIEGIGQDARTLLSKYVIDPNDDTARNALRICLDAKVKEAGPLIPDLLDRPALARAAASAAGPLNAVGAVNKLMLLCANEDKLLAVTAMISLVDLADPSTVATAQVLAKSHDLRMRKAAITLLSKFPRDAQDSAKMMLADPDERVARIAIEILGAVGSPDALETIGSALQDIRPGVRIAAMQALDGRFPTAKTPVLEAMKKDPNPLIRAVAKRIQVGTPDK